MCFRANVTGNTNLFNFYLPLILNGTTKKVIALGIGMADVDMASKYKLVSAGPYPVSKAALNMAMVKSHAQYADQGVLSMSVPAWSTRGTREKIGEPHPRIEHHSNVPLFGRS